MICARFPHWLGAQLIGERSDGGMGRHVELLAQQRPVDIRVANRARSIPRLRHRSHCRHGDSRVEWLERRQLLPALGTAAQVLCCGSLDGELLERAGTSRVKGSSLLGHPPFELGGIVQVESIEQGPLVERDGSSQIATLERRPEVVQIARDDVGIEPQIGRGEEQVVLRQRSPGVVEGLGQRLARFFRLAFCPQQPEQTVARHAADPPSGNHREKCDDAALPGGSPERLAVSFNERLTEGLEAEHTTISETDLRLA